MLHKKIFENQNFKIEFPNFFQTCQFYFRIRELIHWFVTKKLFDNFIMLVIAVSSISLASEDPVDEDSPRYCQKITIFLLKIEQNLCNVL